MFIYFSEQLNFLYVFIFRSTADAQATRNLYPELDLRPETHKNSLIARICSQVTDLVVYSNCLN